MEACSGWPLLCTCILKRRWRNVGTWHDVQERWSHCDDKRSAFNDLGLVVVMAFAYRGVVWEQPLLASVVGDCVTGLLRAWSLVSSVCCGRTILGIRILCKSHVYQHTCELRL